MEVQLAMGHKKLFKSDETKAILVYIIHLLVNNPLKSATTIKKMIALLGKA